MVCLTQVGDRLESFAGLDIVNMEGHSSGNPVPWDIEAGQNAKEYFSMIHVKKGDYAHWGVRIDKATRRVTHVSSGPVIKARDYRNEVLLTHRIANVSPKNMQNA